MQVKLPCRRLRFRDHPESGCMEISLMIPRDMKHSINNLYHLAMKEKDEGVALDLQIGNRTVRRSLAANGKMWAVLGKMADRLDTGVTEQYERALREYGINETFLIDTEKTDEFINNIKDRKNIADVIKQNDKKTEIRVFYGTHTYNNEQMERLLRGICNDAYELGIDT